MYDELRGIEIEEGQTCIICDEGVMVWPKPVNCSCHVNPPCGACVQLILTCNKCGWKLMKGNKLKGSNINAI